MHRQRSAITQRWRQQITCTPLSIDNNTNNVGSQELKNKAAYSQTPSLKRG